MDRSAAHQPKSDADESRLQTQVRLDRNSEERKLVDSNTANESRQISTATVQSGRGTEPQADDVWIAVMGMTGVGKSTFISQLVGKDVGIGHELRSKTQELGVFRCEGVFDNTVWLVDTPGFDDTFRPDVEVLQDIATFFAQLYNKEVRFSGVLYLHRITDPRMSGTAVRNLEYFKLLCGVRAFPIVRLVTTQWSLLDGKKQYEEGVLREKELADDARFLKPLLDKGSTLWRWESVKLSSTKRIIDSLLEDEMKIDLDIQFEMVTQRRTLDRTAIGRRMHENQASERRRYDAELKELEETLVEASKERDKQAMEEIAAERQEYIVKRDRLSRERAEMAVSLRKLQERDMLRYNIVADGQVGSRTTHTSTQYELTQSGSAGTRFTQRQQPSIDTMGSYRHQPTQSLPATHRYHALERGTMRGMPLVKDGENQLEKIKEWLLRFMS